MNGHDRLVQSFIAILLALMMAAVPVFSTLMASRSHAVTIDPAPNGMDMLRVPEDRWREPDGTMRAPDPVFMG